MGRRPNGSERMDPKNEAATVIKPISIATHFPPKKSIVYIVIVADPLSWFTPLKICNINNRSNHLVFRKVGQLYQCWAYYMVADAQLNKKEKTGGSNFRKP
ncbi:unnamed protein product [Nezara viridula]|uniref:Uncharacterized protein n=1 Tax=Nezara viridula TaxID=85310 RepID=A0A9P0H8F5_NEZVI|nr:unnamed protein product [Nezara viridula]